VNATDTAASRDFSCQAIDDASAEAASLRRLLVGIDDGPQAMTDDEIARELNDPFATVLLREGRFPGTAEGVFTELDKAIAEDHPLSRKTQRSFLVGEGSQVAKDPSKRFDRRLRFVVTRGQGAEGPDLLVSAFSPTSQVVELMAWDATQGGFNFYRTIGGTESDRGAWVWAGNSRHAFEPETRARGPFESHPTGNFLMKELKVPWVHWASPKAPMDERDFPAGDPRASHEWFKGTQGAYVLEDSVARPSIERWNRRRLERLIEAGSLSNPVPLMEQLLGSSENKHHTVNLVSSPDSSESAVTAERVRLPPTFFIDKDGLSGVLGLESPREEFTSPGAFYAQALQKFEVAVRNEDETQPRGQGEDPFERKGDVHFAFVVPERAFEDVNFLEQLVAPEDGDPRVGLITQRLAACLLMVDFPNPVFSDARASLLRHVPAGPVPADKWPGFSEELGDAIAAAADDAAEDAPEREFAPLWVRGENGWRDAANQLLRPYYEAVSTQLEKSEGFEGYFKLAEARRNRVREMRIKESPLLFAQTNLSREDLSGLVMSRDGTVSKRGPAG
jgi:hypothetical protein